MPDRRTLSIPVAGTALYIMDQYLNPRNLAAFAGIFMLARTLERSSTAHVVAGVCRLHASADVGVSFFILSLIRGDGKSWVVIGSGSTQRDWRACFAGEFLWRPQLLRPITKRRNGTPIITFRTGRGMSCWESLHRWCCSGGSGGLPAGGSGAWLKREPGVHRVCAIYLVGAVAVIFLPGWRLWRESSSAHRIFSTS